MYDGNGDVTQFGPSGSLVTLGYDVANRVATVNSTSAYAYDSASRVYFRNSAGTETLYVYGAGGPKLATYTIAGTTGSQVNFTFQSRNVNLAGKLISAEGNAVAVDRLGSVRWNAASGGHTYYPYGVEYNATTNNTEKYATYTRDTVTGLDYAMNRYYNSNWGRFMTPDPSGGSIKLRNPLSWNRYVYVLDDPVDRGDPDGLGGPCPPWWNCFTRGLQVVGGAAQVAGGGLLIAAAGTAEVGTVGLSTVFSALGVVGGTASMVSGSLNIAAGLSGNESLGNAANFVTAASNPVGVAVTVTTGNYNYGAFAAGTTDTLTSGADFVGLLTGTGSATNAQIASTLAQPYLNATSTAATAVGLLPEATNGAPVQIYTPPVQVVDQAPQVEPVPSPSGDLGGGGSAGAGCADLGCFFQSDNT